jgi:hypothetical protein
VKVSQNSDAPNCFSSKGWQRRHLIRRLVQLRHRLNGLSEGHAVLIRVQHLQHHLLNLLHLKRGQKNRAAGGLGVRRRGEMGIQSRNARVRVPLQTCGPSRSRRRETSWCRTPCASPAGLGIRRGVRVCGPDEEGFSAGGVEVRGGSYQDDVLRVR